MRHSAMTFADRVAKGVAQGERWDRLWVSDMLDLASFRGLAPPEVARLPTLAYFHENQLTYPVREERERDLHFAFTNLTTALAADRVAFNSEFHRRELLAAFETLVVRMPDHQPKGAVAAVTAKSEVLPQGIDPIPPRSGPRRPGPLRILWVARWEHDKDPETFFAALDRLVVQGVDFRVNVLGESFRQVPAIFEQARERFANHIDHWGYQETRADYLAALQGSDVVVSTARHEFFGIAVVEAIAAGCFPLLPNRLAYPEILEALPSNERARHLYDDLPPSATVPVLADRLAELAGWVTEGRFDATLAEPARRAVARFEWPQIVGVHDEALLAVPGKPDQGK